MIESVRAAIPVAIEVINRTLQEDNVVEVSPLNYNRHYLLTTKKGMRYYMLFKREFFMSFGKIFGFKGIGESVNEEYMHTARRLADTFMFVYPDGKVYISPVGEAYNFAKKNETIRKTKSGETTYSFPVKMLRSWKG